jgi:rubrerythrin
VAETVQDIADHLRNESLESRRRFLRRSAAAGAGALALTVVGSNAALADEVNVDDGTDLEVLQFALTLEHLENAFYRDVGSQFDEKDFRRSKELRGFGNRIMEDVVENFQDIAAHEQTHVDTLIAVIERDYSSSDVVQEAGCYDFGVDDVDDFLSIATLLENTGVSAYDGSLADLDTAGYATAGATIATVEARHASYLNLLTGESPFPADFDTALSRDAVLAAVDDAGFIC